MRRHRFALAAVALVVATAAATAAAGLFTVAPPTTVSGPSPFASCPAADVGPPSIPGAVNYVNAEVEPWVEVDPSSPNHLIGVWQQDRWSDGGARGLVAGVSLNGGGSWTENFGPFTFCSGGNAANGGDFQRASDPWVTFSPNGDAYQIAINFNADDFENAVTVSKLPHGATNWSALNTLIRDSGVRDTCWAFNDKESITADPLDSNYVYAVWDRLTSPSSNCKASFPGLLHSHVFRGPIWFARTTNGGSSWEPARMVFDPGSHNQTISNQIVVLPNGDLLDMFVEFIEHKNAHGLRGSHIAVIKSSDHGATWSKPTVVADIDPVGVSDPDTGTPLRVGDFVPDIAVDLNANSLGLGNVYIVWEDTTSGSASSDDVVYLSRSTNGGATWSAPSPVDKTPPGKAAFLPAVHVAANGVVGVTYYDLRSNDANPGLPTDIWLVHSHDAGATFGDEAHIAGPFDMTTAPDAGGLFVGDYDGLTSIGSAFVPFFVATNNGNTANRTDVFSTQAVPVP